MKVQKLFFPFGMIGAISFLLDDILGTVLWKGYNPVTSYFSQLIADGAPNLLVTRTLFYFYEICLVIFLASLLIQSFQSDGIILRLSFAGLLLVSVISLFSYGLFPMTMDFIVNPKNYVHIVVTVIILSGMICLLFLLALGYWRQKRKTAHITLVAAALILLFNLLHLYAILSGQHNLGLMERLCLYTFQTYIFILSWIYVNQLSKNSKYSKYR